MGDGVRSGLHWVDVAILVAYGVAMLALGWWSTRGGTRRDPREYFTGGGAMSPFFVGVSLFATLLSTITYLSLPGEFVKHGPVFLASALSFPIAYAVVGFVIIPILMRHRVTSAYEILERRLGVSTRVLGAVMFVLLRLVWMATLLNFAARAMLVMTGLDDRWLFEVSVAIGAIALTYSALGGLRAVVVTDFVQSVLLALGAVAVIAVVSWRLDGFDWVATSWEGDWDPTPIFTFDPHVARPVFGMIVMQALWAICTAGGDQTAVQRYMATVDARAARRAYLVNTLVAIFVWLVLALVGMALMAFFQAAPEALPAGDTLEKSADRLFPHFIAFGLPAGLSGLVISGMFAAAMSSVDSGVNSISAVVTSDFVARFRRTPPREDTVTLIGRVVAFAVGIVVIGGSVLVEHVPGNLLDVAKRTTGLLVTPIFTLFFMALFVRFATACGANVGAVAGFVTATLVSFWKPLVSDQALSITWINPTALATGITIGCVASLLTRSTNARADGSMSK